MRKHRNGGTYTAQILVDGKVVQTITYKLSLDAVRRQLMKHANMKSSTTGWVIVVDKTLHRVGIFTGEKGSWSIIKSWPCGDGKPSTPTPEGTYTVKTKGPYFDSGADRCFYYTEFTRHYYFHSVTCNPATGEPRPGKQLGAGTSHGCVRLAKANAKWLMNNVPVGSTVYVYH